MAKQMLCLNCVIFGIVIAFIFQDIHAKSSLDCNFNTGFCDWEQYTSDVVLWKRSWKSYRGYYINVDEYYTGNGRKARIYSTRQRPGQYCLTFLYGMSGHYQGDINVFLLYTGQSETHIFNSATVNAYRWRKRAVISIDSSLEYKVMIEGTRDNTYTNTVWLDDIFMSHGFCTDCDFDTDLCYWTNDENNYNYYNWNLPNSQDGSGSYAHISSTVWYYGKAKLIGPKQSAGKYCISFWYYKHGEQDGGLRVLVEDEQHKSQEIKHITESSGRRWIHKIDKFQSAESFQIAFEGNLKSGIGEIAIDDVLLLSCQDCGDPSPKHGHANASSFQYGSRVEITCETGYNLTGSPFIECQANGVWSNITKCDPFDCGNKTIINGLFNANGGTTFGSTATQICDTGYSLVGNAKVNCTSLGWSSPEARCEIAEEGKSALIAIYAVVPAILVAFAIVIVIILLRKRHTKCMNRTNKCKTALNRPYLNETYNGETLQGQIYANMSSADEPNQSTEEYAVSNDCTNQSVKYSNNGTYKYDVNDTYDHTLNAPKAFEDTTYSHISGKRNNHTDESSYDTTHDRFASSTNDDNCYNVINNTKHIETATSQAKKLIEEPDYDHANAGGPDPTSGDFDDYSHVNRSEKNANIAGMKSATGYEQKDKHTPKYTVEKEKENDDYKPYLKFEAEVMSGGYCEEENHTYFVLEKTEN